MLICFEMDKMISIRAARLCLGLKTGDVAQKIEISCRKLLEYERNPGKLPLRTALKLLELYDFPIDAIQFN